MESDACYVSTDKTGRFLFAAYLFPGMVTVHRIDPDGAARAALPLTGSSPGFTPTTSRPTTPTDSPSFPTSLPRTRSIAFDSTRPPADLTPCDPPKLDTPTGHGPRHLAYHPTLDVVYANAEQASHISVYRIDPTDGSLKPIQSLSTLPDEGFDGVNSTATVRVHPFGKSRLRLQSRPRQHRRLHRRSIHRPANTPQAIRQQRNAPERSASTKTAASSTRAATTQAELPPTK